MYQLTTLVDKEDCVITKTSHHIVCLNIIRIDQIIVIFPGVCPAQRCSKTLLFMKRLGLVAAENNSEQHTEYTC